MSGTNTQGMLRSVTGPSGVLTTRRLLPLLFLLWANLHAAFPLGLVLVGASILGVRPPARFPAERTVAPGTAGWRWQFDSQGLVTLLLCVAATLLTPWGWRIYPEMFSVEGISRVAAVAEWNPTDFHTLRGAIFFVAAGGLVLGRALTGPRWRSGEAVVFLTFTYLVLQKERVLVWWALATTPLVADTLRALSARLRGEGAAGSRVSPARTGERAALNWIPPILLLGHVVGSSPWLKSSYPLLLPRQRPLLAPETPVAMTRVLLDTPGVTRVFGEMGWGGYFSWTTGNRFGIFYDSRVRISPRTVIETYMAVAGAGPGWDRRLAEAGVDTLALSKAHQPALIAAARTSSSWRPVFEDADGAAFVRASRRGQ